MTTNFSLSGRSRRKRSVIAARGAAAGALFLIGASDARAQFSPIRPPSVPLITRTPYVSKWLQNTQAPGNWPNFWRNNTMALTLMVSVDGKPYVMMDAPGGAPNATQTNLQITPTQSLFTFQAGGVAVTADFLSPVEANDLRRLSMPLGDISLKAHSTDGAAHRVRLYCDITGEWAAGDTSSLVRWAPETIARGSDGSGTAGSVRAWEVAPNSPVPLSEINEYPAWGTQVLATVARTGLTSQSGPDTVVRGQFLTNGVLTNGKDTNQPRAVSNNWPTFAFCQDMGTIGAPVSAPFTVFKS